jgi:putative spermidine/putrescine transport system ATP-binding protein
LQSGGLPLTSVHDLSDFTVGSYITLAIRPEALRWDDYQSLHNTIDAVVEDVSFLGSIVRVRCRWGDFPVFMDIFNDSSRPLPRTGQSVPLTFSPQNVLILRDS